MSTTTWGPTTVLIMAIVVIASAAGAVVVIVHPETLNFQTYLDDVSKFVLALAGLAFARGVHLGATNLGRAGSAGYVGNPNDLDGSETPPQAPQTPAP